MANRIKNAWESERGANGAAWQMRWVGPDIEAVASGSSRSEIPIFGDWEMLLLRHADRVKVVCLVQMVNVIPPPL